MYRRIWALLILVVALILVGVNEASAHEGHGDTLERLLDAGVEPDAAAIIAEHFDELDALQESYYGSAHTDGGVLEETIHILTDPAHWIAEFAAELLFLLLIHYWLMEKIIHRHRPATLKHFSRT